MKPAFYSGASGIIAHQEMLDTIGHNLSNVGTHGYKCEITSFDELLYDKMYVNTNQSATNGHGVRAIHTGINFNQESLREVQNPLSFAINGDGLFAVKGIGGEIAYTRNGAFSLSVEQGNTFLVTQDGDYVLDKANQPITLGLAKDNFNLNYEGLSEQIGMYRFANPGDLESLSYNRYRPTEKSGVPQEAVGSVIMSDHLEESGATMVNEMTNMIAAQRGYQLSARVVQTADEMEQVISNLRK